MGIEHIQEAGSSLLKTDPRDPERLLCLLQQPRFKYLELFVCRADILHMLRDSLGNFILDPQTICFCAMSGPERRFDLSLTPVPEWKRNAEPCSDRLIPGLTMIAALHRDVGNPGLLFERRAELRLFDKLAESSEGRMLLHRAGCQPIEVNPLLK